MSHPAAIVGWVRTATVGETSFIGPVEWNVKREGDGVTASPLRCSTTAI